MSNYCGEWKLFQEIHSWPRVTDHSRISWEPITMRENVTSDTLWARGQLNNQLYDSDYFLIWTLPEVPKGEVYGGTSDAWG